MRHCASHQGYPMEPTQNFDLVINDIIQEDAEDVRCVLGQSFLKGWAATKNIHQTILVLTDKRLYQVGMFYDKKGKETYPRNHGKHTIALEDLINVDTTEIPVPKVIGRIGAIMTALGFIVLIGGFIEGSAFGLVVGIFIGAAWLIVPGALMLFYAKSDGQSYLNITHKDGVFALSKKKHSAAELAEFEEKIAAVIGK